MWDSAVSQSPNDSLADLRLQIDQIDKALHDLLIERGSAIDRLIEIKSRQGGGSAFRPAREASMMRAIAERHRGLLPFETVEAIWRIIISTFTYVQAPYSVHIDVSRWRCRDAGFGPVSFRLHRTVCSAQEPQRGDRGRPSIRGRSGHVHDRRRSKWPGMVDALAPPGAPKVIARLPFVERPDHPAGTPVFVISNPLAEGSARDIVLELVTVDRWRPDYRAVLQTIGAEVIGSAANTVGLALLVARPGTIPPGAVCAELRAAGGVDVRGVGGRGPCQSFRDRFDS